MRCTPTIILIQKSNALFPSLLWIASIPVRCGIHTHTTDRKATLKHHSARGKHQRVVRVSRLKVHLTCHQGKVVYAQETRDPLLHVAIKLIVTDSEEHRILLFLQSQGMEVLNENCLIPVLEILSNGRFSFVVMPRQVNLAWNRYCHAHAGARWGRDIDFPEAGPIKNVLHIVHSLLKVRLICE
jgi:hypothetical protein